MRNQTRSLFLVALFLIAGCNATQPESESTRDVEIHLQTWFSQTPVSIAIDNVQIFSGNISTGDVLAYAIILPVKLSEGEHKLSVTVNGSTTAHTSIVVQERLYVGVSYNSTEAAVLFKVQKSPFPYR